MDYESIIIGSGFGGSISAARQSKKWPGKVLLLERGKEYPLGAFPRSPEEFENTGFYTVDENSGARSKILRKFQTNGLFDVRNYKHMNVVMSAGLGGGSLIYANVLMVPPKDVLEHWPKETRLDMLESYYEISKSVLGGNPIPSDKGKEWELTKTKHFQDTAKKLNRDSSIVDIAVFFGNDKNNPKLPGVQENNKYGALQTSCTLCAECDVGCNVHSKNTLDLNYIYAAKKNHKLQVKTSSLVTKITPLNADGAADTSKDGEHGYLVELIDLTSNEVHTLTSRRVTVSAGTLGSNELLLRCRDQHQTLPNLSQRLGKKFSGNGDFLGIVFGNKKTVSSTRGPVITQRIDYNLFDKKNLKPGEGRFIMEDASFPAFLAWFIEGIKPLPMLLTIAEELLVDTVKRIFRIPTSNRLGKTLKKSLRTEITKRASVHLCMGLDASDGVIELNKNKLNIDWKRKNSMPLYKRVVDSILSFKKINSGIAHVMFPVWRWFSKGNVTVHPLGGCSLADNPNEGVVSANKENFGEVFGYKNLFVADGSILPSAVGANPALTISALTEKINERLTGIKPDDTLT